jgi:hypothetical protein
MPLPVLDLTPAPLYQVVTVWGMKCVGYDYKFEKHLARSLKMVKSFLSRSGKKRKAATRDKDDDAMSKGEGEEKEEDSQSDDPTSKRHRVAKGKAKLVRYDWSDARFQGESEDEDYNPT